MKYLCNKCGIISEETYEKPTECSICKAGPDKLELVTGENVPETEPLPKDETEASTFGIRSSPQDIREILKLVCLPKGDTPYKGFPKIVFQLTEDKLTNCQVAPGELLLTILELDTDYFSETWDHGNIVVNSLESLRKMKVLSAYDTASIQVDNVNKILLHQSGKDAGFSDNHESADYVESSKPVMPIGFDYNVYLPKIYDESEESEFKWHVTVDAKSFNPLFEAMTNSDIEYFPFVFDKEKFSTGIGDMENPGMEGAFNINIPINPDRSNLPPELIRVEVGPIFENVIKNLKGEIDIYVAGDELPLWIVTNITKNVIEDDKSSEKVFGKMGYIIPPRSA